MNHYDTAEMEKLLKKKLDDKRFTHTMGVAYTSAALAMRYDADVEKALVAGLLHDNAKEKQRSPKKLLALCKEHNIEITDAEQQFPALLHAKLGAYFADTVFGVKDAEILSAITNHTTGKPDMSLLDKIVYVADYIEPHRSKAKHLGKIRRMAFVDLDQALLMILKDTLAYLDQLNSPIDPMTEKTYSYYKEQLRA